jgi:hypothetical protein
VIVGVHRQPPLGMVTRVQVYCKDFTASGGAEEDDPFLSAAWRYDETGPARHGGIDCLVVTSTRGYDETLRGLSC